MRTFCGHDITQRCAKCAADFDPIQPRRWSTLCRRSKALVDRGVKPEEARSAIGGILSQLGMRLDLVREYDPRKDEFTLLCRDADGKQKDVWVHADLVARVVTTARIACGMPRGLLRPSDLPSLVK